MSKPVLKAYSRRTTIIEAKAREEGITNPAEKDMLGTKTKELLATWKSEYQPKDATMLKGASARIFSTDYPPIARTPEDKTNDQIQRLINSVDRMSVDSVR